MIDDWFDFVCMSGLDFLIILIGVWMLPQLPEGKHFVVAIAVLLSALFFARKEVDFVVDWFKERKIKQKEKSK